MSALLLPFLQITSRSKWFDGVTTLSCLLLYHILYYLMSGFNQTYSVIWLPNIFLLFFLLQWGVCSLASWGVLFMVTAGGNIIAFWPHFETSDVWGYVINNVVFVGGTWGVLSLASRYRSAWLRRCWKSELSLFLMVIVVAGSFDVLAALIPVWTGVVTPLQGQELLFGNVMGFIMVFMALLGPSGHASRFATFCWSVCGLMMVFTAGVLVLESVLGSGWTQDMSRFVRWVVAGGMAFILIYPQPRTRDWNNLVCIAMFTLYAYVQKVSLSEQVLFGVIFVVMNALTLLLQQEKKLTDSLAKQMKKIMRESETDALTGLLNRRGFLARCDRRIRNDERFVLGFVDVNKFKMLNDTLGHTVGDAFLVQLSHLLTHALGHQACLARIGGDEFAFLVPQDIQPACQQALTQLNQQEIMVEGHVLTLSLSMGLGRFPQDAGRVEALLHVADVAMYVAKHRGSRAPVDYLCEFDVQSVPRYSLAEARQLFKSCYAVYQPVLDIQSGSVCYVEVLLRHPDVNTETVLQVCGHHQQWSFLFNVMLMQAMRVAIMLDMPIALNVAPSQLYEATELLASLREAQRAGLPLSSVILEVTENEPITEPAQFKSTVQALRGMGVKLSLDDFGSGFAFFEALHIGFFDSIKIDRSMISDIQHINKKQALFKAIHQYCHHLDIMLVAEGVEVEDEMHYLKTLGVTYMQGYFFARPMTEAMLQAFLANTHGSYMSAENNAMK